MFQLYRPDEHFGYFDTTPGEFQITITAPFTMEMGVFNLEIKVSEEGKIWTSVPYKGSTLSWVLPFHLGGYFAARKKETGYFFAFAVQNMCTEYISNPLPLEDLVFWHYESVVSEKRIEIFYQKSGKAYFYLDMKARRVGRIADLLHDSKTVWGFTPSSIPYITCRE